jgi:hypothetical protein
MMKWLASSAVLVLTVAGAAGHAASAKHPDALQTAIAAEEKAVAGKLKYPDTARFRYMRAYPIKGRGLIVVCGEVGGRNDFGGYTGFVQFIAAVRDGRADPDEVDFFDPTLVTAYPVPKRCQMAASGKAPFYEPNP